MSKLNILKNVVDRAPEHLASHAGMAWFANTGPLGTNCGECGAYHGRGRCLTAKKMASGKDCGVIPAETPSCKYFASDKMVIEPIAKPKAVPLFDDLPVQMRPMDRKG